MAAGFSAATAEVVPAPSADLPGSLLVARSLAVESWVAAGVTT
jgi:hypothetical protein